ncbi:BsaA family SipW-dependent biofilm matrix protein [Clostridium septicum]|uniref:BsaA family SipW-dependent biofilm matrix protein n=1 Tax=Clostridium septicum TaxID=1504 RepID=UPI00082D0B8D|nr:BsaA family SipW-dependent biofilm matrix protein [Clostridium septicum]WLF68876.1 BsaA family SipW-dependent biofilm matrix protein [Clostridium septicum]
MIRRKSINRTILAVGAAAVLVGGTLAWFTSTDTVTNKFKTGGNGTGQSKGVEIWENFASDKALEVLPGTIIDKEVQAQNTATYNSLIRVKLTPTIISGSTTADVSNIRLIFSENVIKRGKSTEGNTNGKWLEGAGGYYYYLGKVAPDGYTTMLLKDVQLDPSVEDEFKGVDFDVVVDAESIQSDNGAYIDAWSDAGDAVLAELAEVVKGEAQDGEVIPGAKK